MTQQARPRPRGKFMWRMLATVLGGRGLVIFFGALASRGLDPDPGRRAPCDRPG
uniref:Uncharacterized protein n=1 Tax=Janibacter limosus TaxID=53458 RepID=A0AC61U1D0_9MICO|nr:hypothetical protein [Janibacter limosus]